VSGTAGQQQQVGSAAAAAAAAAAASAGGELLLVVLLLLVQLVLMIPVGGSLPPSSERARNVQTQGSWAPTPLAKQLPKDGLLEPPCTVNVASQALQFRVDTSK